MAQVASASHRVAHELRRAILRGDYAPGDRLPTEEAICKQFSLSRVPVREGLQILQEQALIDRRRGSGSYVLPRAQRHIPLLRGGYSRSIAPYAHDMKRRVADWRWIEADRTTAEMLHLQAGQSVLWARRHDLLRNAPVAHDELWIEGSVATRITAADLAALAFLERWQSTQRVAVAYVQQMIEAVAATPALMRALGVRRNTPLLKETCRAYLAERDAPGALFISHYRSDVFRLETIVQHRPVKKKKASTRG